MKRKSVLIILAAKDFNETEFQTVKEILTYAGLQIFIASDTNTLCIGNKGLRIKPDVNFFNMNAANFEGVVIIGGKGIVRYRDNISILKVLKKFHEQGKPVGAICAAPVVVARSGILKEKQAVCFPEYKAEIEKEGALFTDEPVVISGKIITARDSFAADEFADSLIYLLK